MYVFFQTWFFSCTAYSCEYSCTRKIQIWMGIRTIMPREHGELHMVLELLCLESETRRKQCVSLTVAVVLVRWQCLPRIPGMSGWNGMFSGAGSRWNLWTKLTRNLHRSCWRYMLPSLVMAAFCTCEQDDLHLQETVFSATGGTAWDTRGTPNSSSPAGAPSIHSSKSLLTSRSIATCDDRRGTEKNFKEKYYLRWLEPISKKVSFAHATAHDLNVKSSNPLRQHFLFFFFFSLSFEFIKWPYSYVNTHRQKFPFFFVFSPFFHFFFFSVFSKIPLLRCTR